MELLRDALPTRAVEQPICTTLSAFHTNASNTSASWSSGVLSTLSTKALIAGGCTDSSRLQMNAVHNCDARMLRSSHRVCCFFRFCLHVYRSLVQGRAALRCIKLTHDVARPPCKNAPPAVVRNALAASPCFADRASINIDCYSTFSEQDCSSSSSSQNEILAWRAASTLL